MNDILTFTTILHEVPGMEALYIEFPYEVEQVYGVRGQVKVKATFDGVPYRGSLSKMGHPCHCLLMLKSIRKELGKNAGDTVLVTVQRDTEERIVEIPEDLAAVFAVNPAAEAFYQTLSYTNRKEYARWVVDAKRPETRANRVAASIEKLLSGKKNPTDK